MDDPWDVKSVRRPGLYTSCMKINGVPLLPPVLSKECRKEMQYYKVLAKEVEKRISILEPYILAGDEDSNATDASEILDSDHSHHSISQKNKIKSSEKKGDLGTTLTSSPLTTEDECNKTPKAQQKDADNASSLEKGFTFDKCSDLKLSKKRSVTPPIDVPERDYDCTKSPEIPITGKPSLQLEQVIQDVNYSTCVPKDDSSSQSSNSSVDGPPSVNSKSFTGSLNNIHIESKSSHSPTKLVRQRSYTLLTPSPQLLAHLEVQSLKTGVEMSCISMSESLNNLSPNSKRRNWDLESAKAKWSNMAKELRQKNSVKQKTYKKLLSPQRSKSAIPEKTRQNNFGSRSPSVNTEPVYRAMRPSPVRVLSNRTLAKEPITTPSKTSHQNKLSEPTSPKTLHSSTKIQRREAMLDRSPIRKVVASEQEDPATKVRELYEKIQQQQLVQMASLLEKQKREQLLLQQVFEEQNNLLFKQLKTICPLSPVVAKEAWSEKVDEPDRGPVSLSQLINHRPNSPSLTLSENVVAALNDSNNYINHCNNVLTKSRDISKQSIDGAKKCSPPPRLEGSKTRTNSPNLRASRRLNYDTSSSNQDYEPMLTDRTNDTMADLNVTFTSDSEDPLNFTLNQTQKERTAIHYDSGGHETMRSTDSAIKSLERTIQNSINNTPVSIVKTRPTPTPQQRAAASTIVAYAKGYLVRRLMRTARVQSTVQTIKDALVCALQLHQDHEGIRGADVDLHRRLIQQITAACYTLHDTFVSSTASERCALIAADRDRGRRASFAAKPSPRVRATDIMSQSHSGAFPSRPKPKRSSSTLMTQSNYENYSHSKNTKARYMPSPRRRPWR